ncbi:UNVERIFIED_CONTAM: hypothetical protein Sradi_4352200 [Sesamum radiatum]|uniref:Uncharacterized protein n=1 Tax=Sesamum radiatum TaxID=300843 RepID=A0AAW2NNW5_SESRA
MSFDIGETFEDLKRACGPPYDLRSYHNRRRYRRRDEAGSRSDARSKTNPKKIEERYETEMSTRAGQADRGGKLKTRTPRRTKLT